MSGPFPVEEWTFLLQLSIEGASKPVNLSQEERAPSEPAREIPT
jgi:hypothetical protein